jgi:hypothetical protein
MKIVVKLVLKQAKRWALLPGFQASYATHNKKQNIRKVRQPFIAVFDIARHDLALLDHCHNILKFLKLQSSELSADQSFI